MKANEVVRKSYTAETVGDVIDYLSQFPRNMPIHASAEADACH